MTEKIKRINNPLTIIAIFAALAEINATIAIGLIDSTLHSIFIWFVIGFPTLLVILFFLTLNYNTKVMYSPSDFKDDKSFIDSMYGNYKQTNTSTRVDFTSINKKMDLLEKNINQSIESKLNEISSVKPDFNKDISELKQQLQLITDTSIRKFADEYKISVELKEQLSKYLNFPAYYVLLYAIIESNSKSIAELRGYSKGFYIPKGWEDAIPNLIHSELLVGSEDNFEINSIYQDDLSAWATNNQDLIKVISDITHRQDFSEDFDKYQNQIKSIAKQIKL